MVFFEPSINSNNELINRLNKNKLKKILLEQKKIPPIFLFAEEPNLNIG